MESYPSAFTFESMVVAQLAHGPLEVCDQQTERSLLRAL